MPQKIKVLHFVTGGFSGATSVALDLVRAHLKSADIETVLVMRQKKTTTPEKLSALTQEHIPYELVSGKTHLLTVHQLAKFCRQWQADILVAHGFPEHILGRWAGRLARVPHLIQIEHNSRERYTPWKLLQSRSLSKHTDYAIGVSEGVADVLRSQQLQTTIRAIPNGIHTQRFVQAAQSPMADRPKDLVMVARYAKSKDHTTLIEALHLLKQNGLTPKLTLVGSGNQRYEQKVRQLLDQYQLGDQVSFIAHTPQVERVLAEHKVFVMSSIFEGLSLSVLEGMAAGCLMVGSDAVGVKELIDHTNDGFIFKMGDAQQLAQILEPILRQPQNYQSMAERGQHKIIQHYDKERVNADYHALFTSLM